MASYIDRLRTPYTPAPGGNVNAPLPAVPAAAPTRHAVYQGASSGGSPGPVVQGNGGPSITNGPWATDPGLVAAQNSYQQMLAQQNAMYAQEMQQAEGAFNGAGNQYSYMAQLGRADQQNVLGYQNNLAARGILGSGEYGYQAQKEAQWKGAQQYAGEQALLQQQNAYRQAYTQALAAGQGDVNNAFQTAYQNYLTNPGQYGHWSNPTSAGGYFPFTPTPMINPQTAQSLVTEYLK